MIEIKKWLVPENNKCKVTYNELNPKEVIVIHETDNFEPSGTADMHAKLQYNGNDREASWHYQVDDREIIQSFEDDVQCWHAGNKDYNIKSIGIEICVNEGGDFHKAIENCIELTNFLMEKYQISKSNVIQHYDANGKNCPRFLRNGEKGISWNDFIAKLDD